jgi:hypothetical protein
VRKKTKEEEKEGEEIQKAVNATLEAEEEKKRLEERKKEDEAKKEKGEEVKKEDKKSEKVGDEDEASPTFNCSCPEIKPCPAPKVCPEVVPCLPCEQCPEVKPCLPCDECGPCPEVRPCKPCRPCGPCPVVNHTETSPSICHCSEEDMGMTVPVALLVGTCAGGLLTGVAAVLGLVIRYFSPIECGFLILAIIIITWYLCSHYPETARELGGRAANLLREAAVALSHRVMAAIQRHQEQVGVPILNLISS